MYEAPTPRGGSGRLPLWPARRGARARTSSKSDS